MASAALDPRQLNVDAPPDVPATREYFYTGGGYEDDGTGTGQHIFTGIVGLNPNSSTHCGLPGCLKDKCMLSS